MEEKNQTTPPVQPETVTEPQPVTPSVTPVVPVATDASSSSVPTPANTPPVTPQTSTGTKKKLPLPPIKLPSLKIDPKLRKKIIIGGIAFILFIGFLLLIPTLIRIVNPPQPVVVVSPTPSPSGAPAEILNPSQYADDEDIKDAETKINDLENKLKDQFLREETLRLPSVDWDITFK